MPNDERRRAVERARDRGRLSEADDWQQARATRRDVPPERPGSAHECAFCSRPRHAGREQKAHRSEEHTSELQSLAYLVCRLLLEKKKKKKRSNILETY